MWISKYEFDKLMDAYNYQSNLVVKSQDRELILVKQIIRLKDENLELKSNLKKD